MTPSHGSLPPIDFHAHHAAHPGEWALQDGIHTWGIHPWTLRPSSSTPPTSALLAIGECGLDRRCAQPLPLQEEAFIQCIQQSEALGKPLFLHCVRALDDCLHLRLRLKATQPWIWHGYRGNAAQLHQLLPHGFWFSFGFRHRAEALLACPPARLLLESDDLPQPILPLYTCVARLLGLPLPQLLQQMHTNWAMLFGAESSTQTSPLA